MRPTLVLLTQAELESLLIDPTQLDGVLVESGAAPPPAALTRMRDRIVAGTDPFWCSMWAYCAGKPDRIVGGGCFKGAPVEGRVEIGYGVADAFRGQGVATSGAEQLLDIAFSRDEVTEVLAETRADNVPSMRVLEKTGRFRRIGERDDAEDGRLVQWLARR
jgi:RimJ/RimL family protein N-acetyltransferase